MTPPSPADLSRVERTLQQARRRLRLRRLVSISGVAAHVGSWLAAAVGFGVGLLLGWVAGVLVAVGLFLVIVAIAATGAALWPGLSRRELALLADQALGTDELLITALHLHEVDDPRREAILAQVDAAPQSPRDLLTALPVRTPRHLMAAPVAWALLGVLLWFAPSTLGPLLGTGEASDDPVVQEGDRLADRLEQLNDDPGITLPDELEREVAALADEMSGDELSPEEALQRLDDLQAQLEAFQDRLEPSHDLLEDLEQAAEALGASDATRDLSEALANGDLDAAADTARDLSEALSESTPAEQQRAADAMQQAGEQLQQSADPSVKQAGEALSRAGDQAQASAQSGASSEGGNPSASGQSPLSPQQAQDLAEQLQQARQAGEQLQHDKQALDRAQKLNGAMEASRQRLGGDAGVDQGASSQGEQGQEGGEGEGGGQQGEGEGGQGEGHSEGEGDADGEGEGEGVGAGAGVGGQAGTGAGQGHTWEDEGEFNGNPPPPGSSDADGDSKRAEGEHIDDFEKFYAGARLEGADSLLASVEDEIDEDGVIDTLPTRLTSGDEQASAPIVELPSAYREAAAAAIEGEQIPPGYRDAVKRYFDDLE